MTTESEPTKKDRFWLKSNRGSQGQEVVELPDGLDEEDIKSELDYWCAKFTAGTAIHEYSYGFEEVKP